MILLSLKMTSVKTKFFLEILRFKKNFKVIKSIPLTIISDIRQLHFVTVVLALYYYSGNKK